MANRLRLPPKRSQKSPWDDNEHGGATLDDALERCQKFWMSECPTFEAQSKMKTVSFSEYVGLLLLALLSASAFTRCAAPIRRRRGLFTNRHLREGSQLIRQDYVDETKRVTTT